MTLEPPYRLDTETPVIILGFTLSGLGIARSLAPRGIDCWILYNDPGDPCLKTRFGRKYRIRDLTGEAIRDGVRAVFERTGKRAVLFPTSDSTVEVYAEIAEEIRGYLCNDIAPANVLRDCMKKDRLEVLYRQADLDFPNTVRIDSATTREDVAQLRYPCILKPSVKSEAYTKRFQKAYFADSPDELLARYREINALAPEAVVQEYLVGPDSDIFFCLAVTDRSGRIVQHFAGRKLASWPAGTGSTAACIPAPEEEAALAQITERFFRTCGFFGIGSLEFKRDRETGRFLAIEPTVARVDTQSELAVLNGINLPLAYYALETGQPLPPPTRTRAVGWKDFIALSRLRKEDPGAKATADCPLRLIDAMWRPVDPGPWLELQRRRLFRAPHALARRAFARHR